MDVHLIEDWVEECTDSSNQVVEKKVHTDRTDALLKTIIKTTKDVGIGPVEYYGNGQLGKNTNGEQVYVTCLTSIPCFGQALSYLLL